MGDEYLENNELPSEDSYNDTPIQPANINPVINKINESYNSLKDTAMKSDILLSEFDVSTEFESSPMATPGSKEGYYKFDNVSSLSSLGYVNSWDMADSIASSLTENFDDQLLDIDNEKLYTLLEDTQ